MKKVDTNKANLENNCLKDKKVALITLGCDKNTVDAEHILYLLKNAGFVITNDVQDAQIIIVNTCAFIKDAQLESIESILSVENLKQNSCEKLIVTGCLSERNGEELKTELAFVDCWLKVADNKNIVEKIYNLYGIKASDYCLQIEALQRVVSTPKHYAFVKIAEGCNNCCSYCTIPKIRGHFVSRPMEAIVAECKALSDNGVQELIIVAQDVTKYGIDLYKKFKIVELINQLSEIENVKWIRLHYCYPELISEELINLIDKNPKVCKYIDIPLQHVSDKVLALMNRRSKLDEISKLIDRIRKCNNYISIRSSFIVGFPQEKSKDFKILLNFLREKRLNNVGFFTYSKEDGTMAYNLKGQVCGLVKKQRQRKAYKLQNSIAVQLAQEQVGQKMEVVCEKYDNENDFYIMRSQFNSPELDTYVFDFTDKDLEIGKFYNVIIIGTNGMDLVCELQKENI